MMPQDNTAKYKNFENGQVLHGPAGSGQNLNVDLQKAMGDEIDAILDELIGTGVAVGLQVQSTSGLAVLVSAGSGLIAGQRVRQVSQATVSGLTPNATDLKIYAQASSPFSVANRAWPLAFGFTADALMSDQLLLGQVNTDGASVTLITDKRAFLGKLAHVSGFPDYFVLKSPNGTSWKFTVDNNGILSRVTV